MKILIVEDEAKTGDYLKQGLAEAGFTADLVRNGVDGMHEGLSGEHDLLILDVNLPGLDGWQVLKALRAAGRDLPVLFLTARDQVEDRVKGLELGADDYLVKPFAFSELLARVRTLLRRGRARETEKLALADLELDVLKRRASRAGKRIDLTAKEFALLELFLHRQGEVLSRRFIASQVWDMNFDSDTNVVEVAIRRLRAKVRRRLHAAADSHPARHGLRDGNPLMVTSWRHSITLRLSLAFALLATLVFAALGVYLGRSADAHMAELDAHELLGKLVLVRNVGARESSPAALAARLGDALVGEHGVIVAVDGEKGAIFRWPADGPAARLATATGGVGETPVRLALGGRDFRIVADTIETGWGETVRVVVARDIRHHTDFLDELQRDFWLALAAAALLTMVVGIAVARRGMQPVRAIAAAAGRISAGQLAERIPEANVPPELAELVSAFNAMLGRLEESFQRLSDFSADLAHELRTPLHALRMQTEVSLTKPRSSDEYRDLLASNLEEYERLSRMIGDMLFLAKAEHGLLIPQREPVRLMDLSRQLVDYYGILAENQKLELDGEELAVHGDRLMLQRAIGNLLLNAIQHTPAQGRVTLAVRRQEDEALVTVSNSGPPIPAAALRTLFDRFIRVDQSGEGSGLGLAIAKSIVLAHGGSIVASSSGQLTEFVITLPLAD